MNADFVIDKMSASSWAVISGDVILSRDGNNNSIFARNVIGISSIRWLNGIIPLTNWL